MNEISVEEVNKIYKDLLKESIVEVSFNKKSTGELRTMRCTLNPKYLPEQVAGATKTKADNPEVVSVFDLDKQDWRSFRIDSVVSLATLEEV